MICKLVVNPASPYSGINTLSIAAFGTFVCGSAMTESMFAIHSKWPHLGAAIQHVDNEFFVIKATLSSRKRAFTSVLIRYKAQKTAQREVLSNADRSDRSDRQLASHLLVFRLTQ